MDVNVENNISLNENNSIIIIINDWNIQKWSKRRLFSSKNVFDIRCIWKGRKRMKIEKSWDCYEKKCFFKKKKRHTDRILTAIKQINDIRTYLSIEVVIIQGFVHMHTCDCIHIAKNFVCRLKNTDVQRYTKIKKEKIIKKRNLEWKKGRVKRKKNENEKEMILKLVTYIEMKIYRICGCM